MVGFELCATFIDDELKFRSSFFANCVCGPSSGNVFGSTHLESAVCIPFPIRRSIFERVTCSTSSRGTNSSDEVLFSCIGPCRSSHKLHQCLCFLPSLCSCFRSTGVLVDISFSHVDQLRFCFRDNFTCSLLSQIDHVGFDQSLLIVDILNDLCQFLSLSKRVF